LLLSSNTKAGDINLFIDSSCLNIFCISSITKHIYIKVKLRICLFHLSLRNFFLSFFKNIIIFKIIFHLFDTTFKKYEMIALQAEIGLTDKEVNLCWVYISFS
jgi:hypothetical protein